MAVPITDDLPFMSTIIFHNSVERDGCWEWQGGKSKGYGRISVNGSPYSTHRIAYAERYGPIPDGMIVRHKCDNPPCCNPDHLELGTQADNIADMVSRGRHVPGPGRPRGTRSTRPSGTPSPNIQGEKHGNAKLADEDVIAIRLEYRSGGVSQRELAYKFAVDPSRISRIVSGKDWTHLN